MRLGLVHHSFGHKISAPEAMRAAHRLGAEVFAVGVADEAQRDALGELNADLGLELVSGWVDRYVENGDAQSTAAFADRLRRLFVPLGIKVVATHTSHHRWRRDPPLPEALERFAAALARLCPVAADHGVTIAVENHADLRADDLLRVLERVNHPALGIQLDTGNPYAVAEEPVEAAWKLAPYTVATHIKDMTIRPLTDGEWAKVLGCPIGEGDVDLRRIAQILAERAPDPAQLAFTLEIEPPGGSDLEMAERGVAWVRREAGGWVREVRRS
ncbi:MAG TPA: sugar phosphate isomerase/epimerase family protein [Limnochordia bacterium]|nr:sugar phosphate isomerase/epimerase family protein [Limnochordia bacterium]